MNRLLHTFLLLAPGAMAADSATTESAARTDQTREEARAVLRQHNILPDDEPPIESPYQWSFSYDRTMRDIILYHYDIEPYDEAAQKMKLLIQAGIDINQADDEGNTYLHDAVRYGVGKNPAFYLLLEYRGVDVNATNKNGESPLYLALERGFAACVEALLRHPNVDISGWSPLFKAIIRNSPAEVRAALAAGADPNERDYRHNMTPLYVAAALGHTTCLQELLEHESTLILLNQDGKNPICIAAKNGHSPCLRYLLMRGDSKVNVGYPLWWAALYGHTDCVRQLLEHDKIDINLVGEHGETALIAAAREGHTEIAHLLLERKELDVNHQDEHGHTALMLAALGNHTDIIRLLLKHPQLNPSLTDKDGGNAVNFACRDTCAEALRLLVSIPGINLSTRHHGNTALSDAASHNQTEAMRILLQAGADANEKAPNGHSLLLDAVWFNCSDAVELLLAQPNIRVNDCAKDGMFPLWCAARNGYDDIVRLLLSHPGINREHCHQGLTPLQIAEQKGHTKIVEILKSR